MSDQYAVETYYGVSYGADPFTGNDWLVRSWVKCEVEKYLPTWMQVQQVLNEYEDYFKDIDFDYDPDPDKFIRTVHVELNGVYYGWAYVIADALKEKFGADVVPQYESNEVWIDVVYDPADRQLLDTMTNLVDAEIKSMPTRDAFIQLTFGLDDVSIARFDGPSGRTNHYPKLTPSSWARLDDLLLRIKWTGKRTTMLGDTMYAYRANPDKIDPTGILAATLLFTDLSAEIAGVADYVVSTAEPIARTVTEGERQAALNDPAVTDWQTLHYLEHEDDKASAFQSHIDTLDLDDMPDNPPPTTTPDPVPTVKQSITRFHTITCAGVLPDFDRELERMVNVEKWTVFAQSADLRTVRLTKVEDVTPVLEAEAKEKVMA